LNHPTNADIEIANQMLWKIDFRFALDSGRSSKQPVGPLCADSVEKVFLG
jgi:hypothetical protein